MRIRKLGRTGLKVSGLCLGAMTFGNREWGCDEATSRKIVDRFLDAGGNFIDTADVYSAGVSEEITGRAIAEKRQQVVLATKVAGPMGPAPNDLGLSRRVLNNGFPPGQRCRHQHIVGGTDRDFRKDHAAAGQAFGRLGDDIAAIGIDIGA